MTTVKSATGRKSNRARPKRAVASARGAAATRIEDEAGGDVRVQLESSLEIKDVEAVYQLFLTALGCNRTIAVDVGGVRTVDTAGAQLLLAVQSEAGRRGVALAFQGESAPLTHTLAALGLSGNLTCVRP